MLDKTNEEILLFISVLFSAIGGLISFYLIGHKGIHQTFIENQLFGKDLNKSKQPIIPEAMGVICALVYLCTTFLLLPFIPQSSLLPYLSALLSLCSMVLLGFADDVLNLRWKWKLIFPFLASIPLLMVYRVSGGGTFIVLPKGFDQLFGFYGIDLGIGYYLFMSLLAVFCTNAINILAGVNGVESGQSVVLSFGLLLNSCLYIFPSLNFILDPPSLTQASKERHLLSFTLLLPYFCTSLSLFLFNKYPARVFVGDTFCYFSGMLFASVGILGHFSKTMMLFFSIQVFNFLYSLPQLFHIVHCPRHRMPAFNSQTGLLEPSFALMEGKWQGNFGKVRKMIAIVYVKIFSSLGLLKIKQVNESAEPIKDRPLNRRLRRRAQQQKSEQEEEEEAEKVVETKSITYINNQTILNLLLLYFGPLHESTLTWLVLLIQLISFIVAFYIRYGLVHYFYNTNEK